MKLSSLSFTQKVVITVGVILVSSLLAIFVYIFTVQIFFPGTSAGNVHFIQGLQFVQSLFTFIVPSLILAALFGGHIGHYLHIDKSPETKYVWLTLGCMIAAIPLMNLFISWNENMILPSWMKEVEQWMAAREAEAKAVTELLLNTHTIGGLFLNLFLIGAMAAIGEEMLFRGLIQRLIFEKSHNSHKAVWITALLFSAIHLQFYGFVPRLLLGAFFGYLVVWTGNLWLPIIAHFFNNTLSVLFDFLIRNGHSEISILDEIGSPGHTIFWSLISLILFSGLLCCFYKTCRQDKSRLNRISSGEK